MFIIVLFWLPETLYIRPEVESSSNHIRPNYSKAILVDGLKIRDRNPDASLSWNTFALPTLRLALKPHVVFPALYYGTQYGFASNLPAVTVASIFSKEFKWDTLQIGLGYGGALTIGGSLGELAAGLVLDALVKKQMREKVDFQPEIRLRAIWHGEILVPAGLLIYGFTMQYKTSWVGPLMGMGKLQLQAPVCNRSRSRLTSCRHRGLRSPSHYHDLLHVRNRLPPRTEHRHRSAFQLYPADFWLHFRLLRCGPLRQNRIPVHVFVIFYSWKRCGIHTNPRSYLEGTAIEGEKKRCERDDSMRWTQSHPGERIALSSPSKI